jgi:hypothetical protein
MSDQGPNGHPYPFDIVIDLGDPTLLETEDADAGREGDEELDEAGAKGRHPTARPVLP